MLASNVGSGIPQRRRDDRLGAEVEDGVDLVLVDRALERVVVLEAAVDDRGAPDVAAANELGLRIPVAHERDDVRAVSEQALDEPRSDDAGGAGDEDAAFGPVASRCPHLPRRASRAQSSSSSRFSRSVSIGCQNPSWRYAISWPSAARRSSGSRSHSVSSPSM